jgi:hypothetical protein
MNPKNDTDYNNTPKSATSIPLPNLEIGQQIDNNRYIVAKSLGKGGQGHVYEVEQENLEKKRFALKCFYASKENKRQLKEINILMNLQHENIVRIYDANIVPINDEKNKNREILYYTMDLEKTIHLENLSWRESCQIIIKICNGLEYAHSKGVIHTDIKPSNILLRESTSSPVLSDFGTAKILSSDLDGSQEQISYKTPAYCAPEQNNTNGKIDPRTDIFSLGKTLFAMLIRKELSLEEIPKETKEFHEFVKKTEIEGVPSQAQRRLKKIIVKATQEKVSNRYNSAREMAEKLENILQPKTPLYVYLLLAFWAILCNTSLFTVIYGYWGDWATLIKIIGHNPDQFLFLFGFYPLLIWFTWLILVEFWLHSRQKPYLRMWLFLLAFAIGACPFWSGRIGVGHDFFHLQPVAGKETVWANRLVLQEISKNGFTSEDIRTVLEKMGASKSLLESFDAQKKLDIPNNEDVREFLKSLAKGVLKNKSFSSNPENVERLNTVKAFLFLQFIYDRLMGRYDYDKVAGFELLYFPDLINDFVVDCVVGLFAALFGWYLFYKNQIGSTARYKLASLFLLSFSVVIGIWVPAHQYNLEEISFVYETYKDHQGTIFVSVFFLFIVLWTFPIFKSIKDIFWHTWPVALGITLLYFIKTDLPKVSEFFGSNIQTSILMLVVLILVFWVSCIVQVRDLE